MEEERCPTCHRPLGGTSLERTVERARELRNVPPEETLEAAFKLIDYKEQLHRELVERYPPD